MDHASIVCARRDGDPLPTRLNRGRNRAWAIRAALAQGPGRHRATLLTGSLASGLISAREAASLAKLPEQVDDEAMRLHVARSHSIVEMTNEDHARRSGFFHPDTWGGTEELQELPDHPDVVGHFYAEVLAFDPDSESWLQIFRTEGSAYPGSRESAMLFIVEHLNIGGIWKPNGIGRPVPAIAWPREPAFFHDVFSSAKHPYERMEKLIEESTLLIHRSLEVAIHLLQEESFG